MSAGTAFGNPLKTESPRSRLVAICPTGRLATCIATFSAKASRGRISDRNYTASQPEHRQRAAILHDSPSRRPAARFGRVRNGVPLPLEHCPRAAVDSRASSSLHIALAGRSVPRVTVGPGSHAKTAANAGTDTASWRTVRRRRRAACRKQDCLARSAAKFGAIRPTGLAQRTGPNVEQRRRPVREP